MKRIFRNNRLIAIVFCTFFSVALAPAVPAQGKDTGPAIELKFVGKMGYQPLFELSVNNVGEESPFTIYIKDVYDNLLYTENIKAQTFLKRFLLNTDELGDVPVKFEVYNRKTRKVTVFEVIRNKYYVDEMVVNEVK